MSNEVAQGPTQVSLAATNVTHLESIDTSNFPTGYRAIDKSTNILYVLDHDRFDIRNGTTVLWTKNAYGNAALPGRWISECTYCPGGTGTGVGPTGPAGPAGPAGGFLAFANFFALMPGDNAATIAANAPVLFPQNGPTSASGITRTSAGVFAIANPGIYQVIWQVSVTEPGQLEVFVNGVQVSETVVGRATGTSQLVGNTLITIAAANSSLEIRNPAGNAAALTITPFAGGTHSVSATLTIVRLT